MRLALMIMALGLVAASAACARTNAGVRVPSGPPLVSSAAAGAANTVTLPARVDFVSQIRPILEAKCQPCHFNGGKMYQRMPFDRAETIKTLGTRLFTRIKEENERQLIRDFLAQQ